MITTRIHTRIESEWDGDFMVAVCEEGYWYKGPMAFCKGDDLAKEQEQSQINFNNQLMQMMNTNWSNQQQLLSYMKGKLQPMIDNPTGYSDAALAAMRTSATDSLSSSYQNAQKALNNEENAKNGGSDLPAGTTAQLDAALLNSEATDKANAQNTITMNNANLQESNYWNALNVLNGQTANQYNPLGYASAYNQGSGDVASLSNAYKNSQQSGWTSMLGGLAGGIFGAAGNAGSFGALFCWMAAKVFKEGFFTGRKTNVVRRWLHTEFAQHWYARPILNLYARYGEWASRQQVLVWAFTPAFERAYLKAAVA
jgi:hypothetical protein